MNELRGEIGATLKGSKDARDRLVKSEYIMVLCASFGCVHLK